MPTKPPPPQSRHKTPRERKPILPIPVAIEEIEDLRRLVGIEDLALSKQVRRLAVGDFVKVTLLTGERPCAGETLSVRITAIRGLSFTGELAGTPVSASLAKLRAGSPIAFTRAHIHSAGQAVGDGEAPDPAPLLVKPNGKGPPMSANKKSVLPPPKNSLPPRPFQVAGTTDERLQQIAALGERINGYVQFIGQIDKLAGTSGEAKAAAVDAFHRRMVALDHHLAKIQEELQLG